MRKTTFSEETLIARLVSRLLTRSDWVTWRHLNVALVTNFVTIVTKVKTGYWRRRLKSVLSNDLFKSQCESKHLKLSIILISPRVIKAISNKIYCIIRNMTSFYIMPINNILVKLYNNFGILKIYCKKRIGFYSWPRAGNEIFLFEKLS